MPIHLGAIRRFRGTNHAVPEIWFRAPDGSDTKI